MLFPAALFRAQARKALRGHWQTALLIALAVNLPSLLVQAVSAFTGADPLAQVQNLLITVSRDGMMSQRALEAGLERIFAQSSVWVSVGATVLVWLVTPCLSLGMNRWLLLRLRNQEGPFSTVFSLLRIAHKAIGLQLLRALLVLLWMLPGVAVMLLSALPLLQANAAIPSSVLSAMNSSLMFSWGGMILMGALGVIAALRYALSDFLLADAPEKGIRACLRESRQRMHRRKGMLFSLELSFIFWYLGEMLVASFLSGLGAEIPSLMFQMLASLFLTVYLQGAVGSFFEAVMKLPEGVPVPPPSEAETPESLD